MNMSRILEMLKQNKQYVILAVVGVVAIVAVAVFLMLRSDDTTQDDSTSTTSQATIDGQVIDEGIRHALSGRECENNTRRPYAIMMASDRVVRPLSGLGSADIVVEIPVIQGGITRLMAVFACEVPEEIGSIRSSRHDFIPVAASFDAIYGHWGGSSHALAQLREGVINNIDALPNPAGAFERKGSRRAPHNGFTSLTGLDRASKQLGYRMDYEGPTYPRIKGVSKNESRGTLSVRYGSQSSNVSYEYNPTTNQYARMRGGTPEIDALTDDQVVADNIVVLVTKTRHFDGQYNDVDVTGSGKMYLAQNGEVIEGRWTKAETPLDGKIFFYDQDGQEMSLVIGNIWMHFVDENTGVVWDGETL